MRVADTAREDRRCPLLVAPGQCKKKITFAFVDVVAFFSKFFVLVVCKGFQEFN